ncbi:hexosaminidase D-like [Oratosquilla oratoria]|uniref:hexosaminidase D-like n=1 Tax=Oratosquilla oratoria TaxID=337810 RepID=UPI003F75FC4E
MVDFVNRSERLFHLDLKGAAPRIEYYKKIFPLVASLGATGLLVEYEDMFPYSEPYTHLQAPYAYTPGQIAELQNLAKQNNLSFIPLIQTLGHFEFVLKHDRHRSLRELDPYPNSLCPTHPEAFPLVSGLIHQMVQMHPTIKHLHIGADEVWHLGKCPRCQDEMMSKPINAVQLWLAWIGTLARWIKENYPNITIIIWDDMIRTASLDLLKESGIGKLVEPMVWQYYARNFNLPEGMFDKFAEVFDTLWVASAFKGATGSTQFMPPLEQHISNQLTWLAVIALHAHKFKRFAGIALTGWQRYDHYAVLCELLPMGIPSLALCLRALTRGSFNVVDHEAVSQALGFQQKINITPFPRPQILEQGMTFPGHKIYLGVQMWSNFIAQYKAITSSEGMVGWFSTYLRSRNFTNPVQVETIMNPLSEVHQNLHELRDHMSVWMAEVFYQDTIEEWIGCFIDPILGKIENLLEECKKHILLGGRVRYYPIRNCVQAQGHE